MQKESTHQTGKEHHRTTASSGLSGEVEKDYMFIELMRQTALSGCTLSKKNQRVKPERTGCTLR